MASTFKRRTKTNNPSMSAGTSNNNNNNKVEDSAPAVVGNNANSTQYYKSMLGLSGTKPWTGGTTLTSCGLRDLDGILGGGQPLGTCILVEEDRWTQSLALSLVKYWCAEAISNGQHLMIPTTGCNRDVIGVLEQTDNFLPEDRGNNNDKSGVSLVDTRAEIMRLLDTLPRNLHWDKQKTKLEGESAANSKMYMETLEEDEEAEEGDDDSNLKIAWQYRSDVQRERLGQDGSGKQPIRSNASSDIYCHSYDLSGRLAEQLIAQENDKKLEDIAHISPLNCCDNPRPTCGGDRRCGFQLFQRLLLQVENILASEAQTRKVLRLLLFHYNTETLAIALPLLLAQVRLQQMPVVVLVSVQPWKASLAANRHSSALSSLQRTSDVVLQTEGFAARSLYPPPPEFRHLHGLLLLRKVTTVTSATAIGGGHYADLTMSKRPPANIYGLKRDRRKLHIPLLHIPPEDHAEGGGSVGGGGVRSGAGRPASKATSGSGAGCGSGNQSSSLDF